MHSIYTKVLYKELGLSNFGGLCFLYTHIHFFLNTSIDDNRVMVRRRSEAKLSEAK